MPILVRSLFLLAALSGITVASAATGVPLVPFPDPDHVVLGGLTSATGGVPTGRLPRTVLPQRVALDLELDPAQTAFSGRVRIDVEITAPTAVIWMHGRDLRIDEARYVPHDGEPVALAAQQVHASGVLRLQAPSTLARGRGRIEIRYRADYETGLEGAYRVEVDGRHYVLTQMEPLGARSAFPGFDEPAFKHPWDVTLTVPADQVAVANTRQVAADDAGNGRKRLRFATTEPLASYLIAFAVGPWDVVEAAPIAPNAVRRTPLPLRGLAVHGKGTQLDYALRHTGAIVAALEDYFGLPYPFDKLDLIAAPDFGYGAMENAGLIVYTDTLLLGIDKAPTRTRYAFWVTHTHELSHQWFGNLVTMPWWDDLWLNEAFASWQENRIAHRLRPEFNFDRALVENGVWAMSGDSLASTRRVREPIAGHTDVQSAFDAITYSKGGAVLAMFESYMGETAFRDAVRGHMRRFERRNATSDDLIASLGTGRDDAEALAAAFRSFIDQPGVPFVHADVTCTDRPRVTLRQQRYVPLGSTVPTAQRWSIPLCMSYGDADARHRQCVLFDEEATTVDLDTDTCPRWLLPNADAGGYYRFAVAEDDRAGLTAAFPHLEPMEQRVYADSLVAAFENGTLSAAAFVDALPALAANPVREVATAPLNTIYWLRDHLYVSAAQRAEFVRRVAEAYRPRLDAVGIEARANDTTETVLLRGNLLRLFAFALQDAAVRAALAEHGRAIIDGGGNGTLVPDAAGADLRSLALRMAAALGGEHEYMLMDKHARTTDDPLLRQHLRTALGQFEQPELARRARDASLEPQWQASELFDSLWTQFGSDRVRDDARAWIRTNLPALEARVPKAQHSGIPAIDAWGLCSDEDADALAAFYRPKMAGVDGGPRAVEQAVEETRLCAARRRHHEVQGSTRR